MHVADLQQFLRSLIPPLESSGAKAAVLDGLESASRGLDPFKALDVAAFASFLARAEEYDRTGIVPVATSAAKSRTPKAPKPPAMTVADALAEVFDLYDRCVAESVTFPMIEASVKKLEKLTAADLNRVTLEFGVGKPKTKAASIAAIIEKINDRKQNHQRTQF